MYYLQYPQLLKIKNNYFKLQLQPPISNYLTYLSTSLGPTTVASSSLKILLLYKKPNRHC